MSLFRSGLMAVLLVLPVAGRAANEADRSTTGNSSMPRCGPPMDGQVYCKFGIIYECQLISPNSMERRTGWRWTADLLRGCARDSPVTQDQPIALPQGEVYAPDSADDPCSMPGSMPGPRPVQNGARPTTRTNGAASAGTMLVRPDGFVRPDGRARADGHMRPDGSGAAGCR
jgi:hypothetical protein